MKSKLFSLFLLLLLAGCRWPGVDTHENKTMPAAAESAPVPTLHHRILKRDGTNYIGVYLGMVAEHDGNGGVAMFSDTSGELLKWVSWQDFTNIFVLRIQKEYP